MNLLKKKCKVVILPTNNRSLKSKCDCKEEIDGKTYHGYQCGLVVQSNKLYLNGDLIHLYIVSDDEIKEGDCFLNDDFKVYKCDKIMKAWISQDGEFVNKYNKVITATNPELHKESISNIPQSFIEMYVEEYNKGNVIDTILVEYTTLKNKKVVHNNFNQKGYIEEIDYKSKKVLVDFRNGRRNGAYISFEKLKELNQGLETSPILKLNSDNTINIHKIRKSFTKEDLWKAYKYFNGLNSDKSSFETWFEQNY